MGLGVSCRDIADAQLLPGLPGAGTCRGGRARAGQTEPPRGSMSSFSGLSPLKRLEMNLEGGVPSYTKTHQERVMLGSDREAPRARQMQSRKGLTAHGK